VLLLWFPCAGAAAQDYAAWIGSSDSRDNQLIAEMIDQGDLTVGMQIAAALGGRQDAEIGDIILAVGEVNDARPQWERELILRALLVSVFPSSLGASDLETRLAGNREGFDFLVAGLPGFTLSLEREVVRLLGFLHPPEYLGTLMREGRRLTELLQEQEGRLNGEQAGLILTYLETVRRIADPEFTDIVLFILQSTRHLEVAQMARTVSRSLLAFD
jgi:hypothetical protein